MRHRASRTLFCAAMVFLELFGQAAAQKSTGAILPGGNSKKPINIEALKLDYFDREQKLIYTGNVVASQGDAKLKASVLTIFLAPKSAAPEGGPAATSTSQVQRMLATGPVTLVQRDQIGTGNSGVYDRGQNSVVLTGNVTLSQGPNVTKGDRLTYDLKNGQAVVTGRVKSMFLPESNRSDGDAAGDGSESGSSHKGSGRQPEGRSAAASGPRRP